MQLAIYICQRRIALERGWLSGEDLCTCEVAWFLILKGAKSI